jgi:hypothetical protein
LGAVWYRYRRKKRHFHRPWLRKSDARDSTNRGFLNPPL